MELGPDRHCTHPLFEIVYYCVSIQHDIDKSQISFIELCKTLRMHSGLRAIIADCGVWTHPHFYTDLRPCSPYSITERRVPELIPVLGSQPAGDANHKPDGRLLGLLLSARPAVN